MAIIQRTKESKLWWGFGEGGAFIVGVETMEISEEISQVSKNRSITRFYLDFTEHIPKGFYHRDSCSSIFTAALEKGNSMAII